MNMRYINNMRNENKEKTEKLENRKDSHNNFKKNMKKILSVALAVLVISGVTACRNQSDGDKNDTNITNTVKDSVIIAIGSEPETLDPTKGWGHGNSPIIQSTLVKYNAELNFENDLATGYELSEDGLTWTFTIRDDAFFTDGEKVTAEDVAFTL